MLLNKAAMSAMGGKQTYSIGIQAQYANIAKFR